MFYDEIRAFTAEEIAWMQGELNRVEGVISKKKTELLWLKLNQWNWIIDTQRDAMTRMENAIKQDERVQKQLKATRDSTIESGDTEKLDRWFDLSRTVGSAADLAAWNKQKAYASTATMVSTVGAETADQIKNPAGINWKWWLIVGGAVFVGTKILDWKMMARRR